MCYNYGCDRSNYMSENNVKLPQKNAGKRLRELYEKKRKQSKASDSLIEGLKDPADKEQQKKSAIKPDLEI